MTFWIVAFALAAVVALTLILALVRRGAVEGSATSDIQVYRDQLDEVERDLAKGVISQDEAGQIRLEVSRRLLEADRAAQASAATGYAPRWATWGAAGTVALAVVGGAVWLYAVIGAPGYPDLPLDRRIALAEQARLERPDQAAAEAEAGLMPLPLGATDEYLELMERLRATLEERPNDLQGHRLLARNEAGLGNFPAAHRAQARVIELLGDGATVQDSVILLDYLVLAAGGYVSPEAEAVIERVLAVQPGNGTAQYYAGLLAAQTGRPDVAFGLWRTLLEASGPDAPWVPPIRAQIGDIAALAGVDYVVPGASEMRGPSAGDIAAAEDMSPADRLAMIEGMVSGLSERLATEGGPAEDWARLIRAYGVLGQRDRAAAIWAEAQTVFPDDITRVQILQAARDAGVEQ